MTEKKVILHLCADIGSDSLFYQRDDQYEVIMVGEDIGVQNFNPPRKVHGIIANPVCTEFSILKGFNHTGNLEDGMFLVNHCIRIIEASNPAWWLLENPAKGRLKEILGSPVAKYQPWHYGSPWTKETALWGKFTMPLQKYWTWDAVPKIPKLYTRPGRIKPNLAYFHKSEAKKIPEMTWALEKIKKDSDIRSMCSQGFAKAFKEANP